jgi:Ricin-type beta-trefoil lectin domain-like
MSPNLLRKLVIASSTVIASAILLITGTQAALANQGLGELTQVGSDMCLDDTLWSTSNGTIMQQWQCFGHHTNQFWTSHYVAKNHGDRYYEIINNHSHKCLDVIDVQRTNYATKPGTAVQQWRCLRNHSNQEWTFVPAPDPDGYFIENLASSYMLEISGNSPYNGAKAISDGFALWNTGEWYCSGGCP